MRPLAVTQPVLQHVQAARPSGAAGTVGRPFSPFPLETMVPRGTDLPLVMTSLAVIVQAPAGQVLARFPAGHVRVLPGTKLDVKVVGRQFIAEFSPGLRFAVQPHRVDSAPLRALLALVGGIVPFFSLSRVSLDLGTPNVVVDLRPVGAAEDSTSAGKIAELLREVLTDEFSRRLSLTELSRYRYSLLTDRAPLETLSSAIDGLTAEMPTEAGPLAQLEAWVSDQLVGSPEVKPLRLRDMRLTEIRAGFEPQQSLERSNASGDKTLVLARSSALMTFDLDARLDDLLAVLTAEPALATPDIRPRPSKAQRVIPALGLQFVDLTGDFEVRFREHGAVATFARVTVRPDGTVDVGPVKQTEALERVLRAELGVDLLAVDRTASGGLAFLLELIATAARVGDTGALATLVERAPAQLLEPALRAGIGGYRSDVVEPAVRRQIELMVEEALNEQIPALLHGLVRESLGVDLDELLRGQPLGVRLP